MCLFTSALRASVNKSHVPSLPQNNLYLFTETEGNSVFCGPETAVVSRGKTEVNNGGRGATQHTAFTCTQCVPIF